MTPDEILSLFDKEQRRESQYTDSHPDITPDVVRQTGIYESFSFVMYANLSPDTLDSVIETEIRHVQRLGHDLEWKVFDHDPHADLLKKRLLAHGFEAEEVENMLVLDITTAPAALRNPVSHDIRRIKDPSRVRDVLQVEETVWEETFNEMGERLRRDIAQHPDHLSVFVAYVDDLPVSSAWIYYYSGSQFAGLWGGSTLPAFRGRGFYTALLAVRLQEAASRGIRFSYVDASDMSKPILQKHGFQLLTYTQPFVWRHKG